MTPSQTLTLALNQAIAALDAGRYSELEMRTSLLVGQYPDLGLAWKLLGVSLQAQGKDALPVLQMAAKLLPDDAAAHSNLGNALRELGQLEEAVASCRRALGIHADYAQAHNNLGAALVDLGRFDDAVASCRSALEIDPDFFEAHNNLGNALHKLGQFDSAASCYRRALDIKPDYAEAHSNLGNALKGLGQFEIATVSYRRALEINPYYAEAHNNLGNVQQVLGQLDNSLASCRRALEIKPDSAEANNNLGYAFEILGRLDDALASYRRALQIKPDFIEVRNCLLFIHNYLSDQAPETMLQEARRFGELVARQARPYQEWSNQREVERCLRIGIVSGDLWNHPVGYFAESVLAALSAHAHGRLELMIYASHSRADALTEKIKASAHGWQSTVGMNDERLAQKIRAEGIDILIDLSGHTAHNRLSLFAWKPAPVQATWLGYFATTGVAAIDYLI
ncbi:MAG: tetratricopeptide repeat protein, partial [Proteobacteria bacterium]|nr:tetratricopeptide repeat protein [Pseudomonadota bacterium]